MWEGQENCKQALKSAIDKNKKNLSINKKNFLETPYNICGFFKLKIDLLKRDNYNLIVPENSGMVLFNKNGNNITPLTSTGVNKSKKPFVFEKDCKEIKIILSKWFNIKGTDIGEVGGDEVFGWYGTPGPKPRISTTLTGRQPHGARGGSRKRRRNKIKSNKKKSLPKKNRISKKKNSKNLRRRIRVNGKKSQRRI